jgi:hypothetical protein
MKTRHVFPTLRGTQRGLKNRALAEQIRSDMLQGRFYFQETRAIISGVIDPRGVYYVIEGHHRMAAAMDIYKKTGDPSYVLELIRWGKWDHVEYRPIDGRPLPALDWWGALRNWIRL